MNAPDANALLDARVQFAGGAGMSDEIPNERPNERATTYAEIIALLDALPVLSREKRRRLNLSFRAASEASGVPFSSIKRIEDGAGDPAWTTARNLLRWIGLPDQLSLPVSPPVQAEQETP